jgi:hypothetical protein
MFSKTKMMVAAALVIGSAGAALADDMPYSAEKNAYLRNPNAPVPHFTQTAPVQTARGLVEGRNVGVGAWAPAEQKRSSDRNAIDFNS